MVTPPSPEQVERNRHGIAACRAALAPLLARRVGELDDDRPLTRSEEIHRRARERATATRRPARHGRNQP